MGIFQIVPILAAFLCSLVAGFLFAFTFVVMPGIRSLNDREFIRAFQVMDGIIQDNQPTFVLVWVGSVVALVTSAVLGFGQLDGAGRLLHDLRRTRLSCRRPIADRSRLTYR